ncbi:uracil-xanthine permease family protein [Aerococcus christensenii]|uniref:uracil-xanthine permease family protein n=1 Tax=Aerococcus christensenii TaxID=87541 RepID=UPI0007632B24|nr:solute carrier family 23 protein [Aerococcus christensenii]AMB92455.1 xanthine/uracil permease [Aerococcus christensenii]
MSHMMKGSNLEVKMDEKVPLSEGLTLGLQHALSMNVYVGPMIIAGMIGLSSAETTGVIQSTFIASGLAMILQTLLMKLPVAQGASFIPIAALSGISMVHGGGMAGWSVAMTASLIGALVLLLVGFTGFVDKLIHHFIPHFVGSVIVLCIGLSLMPAAVGNIYHAPNGSVGQNLTLGMLTVAVMVICSLLGEKVTGLFGKVLRIGSVLLTFIVGCVVAYFMGILDASVVGQADWVSLPLFLGKDIQFTFDGSSVLTVLIVYLLLLSESAGTWIAMANTCETSLTTETINKGVIGEALSCVISSIFGTSPMTGFSSNAGIICLTKVASRQVFVLGGALLFVFGLSGKLSALISVIPGAVIGGIFLVICGTIFMGGLQSIDYKKMCTSKGTFVVILPVATIALLQYIPQDFLNQLPEVLKYFLGSPVSVASLLAIVLNKAIPEKE